MTDPVGLPEQPGPQEGRCGAIKQRDADGNPIRWCRKYPRRGQSRCEDDGGSSPQALAAAERRQQEEQGRALVAKYGLPVHIEWHEALQGSLNEAYGNLLFLRDLVQQITPEALTWGTTQQVTVGSSQFPGVDVTKAAGITPVAQMYERALDRVQKYALDAGKLGLEVHKQRVSDGTVAAVADVIRKSFAAMHAELLQLGLPPELQSAWPQLMATIVPAQLRALTGGETAA